MSLSHLPESNDLILLGSGFGKYLAKFTNLLDQFIGLLVQQVVVLRPFSRCQHLNRCGTLIQSAPKLTGKSLLSSLAYRAE